MSELKRYKVSIFNESYLLVGDEPADLVMQAASIIDSSMNQLAKTNMQMDSKQIAVLVALKLAAQMLSQQQISDKLIGLVDKEIHNA